MQCKVANLFINFLFFFGNQNNWHTKSAYNEWILSVSYNERTKRATKILPKGIPVGIFECIFVGTDVYSGVGLYINHGVGDLVLSHRWLESAGVGLIDLPTKTENNNLDKDLVQKDPP